MTLEDLTDDQLRQLITTDIRYWPKWQLENWVIADFDLKHCNRDMLLTHIEELEIENDELSLMLMLNEDE